jgi:competence protein ComEC
MQQLGYGSRLVFNKPLQPIRNTGAAESFDYKRYAAFQGIYHQIYLRRDDLIILPGKNENYFKKWILRTRSAITGILQRYIPGRTEAGLAEALLIGYKDDLDKSLLQSYANTGVVHIIAISGLHVGLIYWLLTIIIAPMSLFKLRWMKALVIITGLWLFALLAGGSPSVLRSALMFSCMVMGEQFFSKVSVYNTLAVSAFMLLCIDPFWFWDVGFQLSYIAVLSIVIFMKPVYGWLFFQNKLLDLLWKLNAVTLAAQVLTVPLSIYYFHQFPNYFLITNLVAVPLSTLIVLGEILLCALAIVPAAAAPAGIALQECIRLMNRFIAHMEGMPLALWKGLQLSTLQLALLYVVVAGMACWLMRKDKKALLAGLCGLLGLVISRAFLW